MRDKRKRVSSGGSLVAVFFALLSCERSATQTLAPAPNERVPSERSPSAITTPTAAGLENPGPEQAIAKDAAAPVVAASKCPPGMELVTGGEFWMGASDGAHDERPRFKTRVADFCLDQTEVTVASYDACVAQETCTPAVRGNLTCNAGRAYRASHPINCVTWEQAVRFCEQREARLPSEVEWEYAARGGDQQRKYSWGDESPDGRTCWKTNRTCPVQSYEAGAFGLYDIQGNVWEWTSSAYGPYPWPAADQPQKIYRGGSWSRRFEKWMSSSLRNRLRQTEWGSHLGFRCALTPAGVSCPYGRDDETCQSGVDDAECEQPAQWNGARCAPVGAGRCPSNKNFVAGQGCVSPQPRGRPTTTNSGDPTQGVSMVRSPGADADCRKYQATRPYAVRLTGGSHRGRNLVGQKKGCKNRDVGVGWNSACCPAP